MYRVSMYCARHNRKGAGMNTKWHADMTEMLILHVVAPGDTYGYDIAQQTFCLESCEAWRTA